MLKTSHTDIQAHAAKLLVGLVNHIHSGFLTTDLAKFLLNYLMHVGDNKLKAEVRNGIVKDLFPLGHQTLANSNHSFADWMARATGISALVKHGESHSATFTDCVIA